MQNILKNMRSKKDDQLLISCLFWVQEFSIFPQKGCIQILDGILVVKLGES